MIGTLTRFKSIVALVLLGFMPCSLLAVGLGQVKITSKINERLRAQIPILAIGNVPVADFKVNLADTEQGKVVGFEQNYLANNIKLTVTKDEHDNPIILLTSDARVNEPYMRFLLNVSWPNGQYLRAYTLLLDPAMPSTAPQRSPAGIRREQALPRTTAAKNSNSRLSLQATSQSIASTKIRPTDTLKSGTVRANSGRATSQLPVATPSAYTSATTAKQASADTTLSQGLPSATPSPQAAIEPLAHSVTTAEQSKPAMLKPVSYTHLTLPTIYSV